MTGVDQNRRFSTNISQFITNGAEWGHIIIIIKANRNSYALYRIVLFPMTVSGHSIFYMILCRLSYLPNWWR